LTELAFPIDIAGGNECIRTSFSGNSYLYIIDIIVIFFLFVGHGYPAVFFSAIKNNLKISIIKNMDISFETLIFAFGSITRHWTQNRRVLFSVAP